ncbi:hypothetical protein ADL27_39030, partial [Streptomyces sp. NRRL F-6602]
LLLYRFPPVPFEKVRLPDALAGLPYPPRLDAAGPGTLWATGTTAEQNGTPVIARYEDGRWSTVTPPPDGHLLDLVAFGPDDVWTMFHSYAFDFTVWELWGALAHGGRLVVVGLDTARAPEEFARLLAGERVTVLNQT